MNPIHVRFEHAEAIEAKKLILSGKANLIGMQKKIHNYKITRQTILAKKIQLKKSLRELSTAIDITISALPKIEKKYLNEVKKQGEVQKPQVFGFFKKSDKKAMTLEQELQDIQKQLSVLNQKA